MAEGSGYQLPDSGVRDQREDWQARLMAISAAAIELVEWADGRRAMPREEAERVIEMLADRFEQVRSAFPEIKERSEPYDGTDAQFVKGRFSDVLRATGAE